MLDQLKIFSGNANPELAKEICRYLKIPVGRASINKFPDGEIELKLGENVRGCDAFIIQPSSTPANDHLMELLLMIDAMRRASARRITAVIPYYGYGRQDRKTEPRVPISAKLVANLITVAGANRVLAMDLHAGQIQGFFDIPFDHLYANPVFIDYFKKKKLHNLVVVSPDAGGVERARAIAKRLNTDLAIIDKRRMSAKEAVVLHIIGDVKGKDVLIYDDLVDTAGTLSKAAQALKEKGAKRIIAACTHGVLADPAIERINQSAIEELVITNTIRLDHKKNDCKKIVVLSVSKLFGEAILRIHQAKSLSELFI
ncbi:MAG: ribose-phosphate pyrophosphokinase [Elusimicrobiota bacterium]